MLLTFISLTSQKEKKSYKFQSTNVTINPSDFQTTAYKDIDYDAYQQLIKKIVIRYNIIREHVLEEKFPELETPKCGDGPCRTMMYDLTNHNLHKSRIKSMPTILLIGGIHGTETLGIQTLVQFVIILQKLYRFRVNVFKMLNNMRILVIPVLNMNGFYNGEDLEEYNFNGEKQSADPNFDFNMNPKKSCFSTVSSQYIHKLYNEHVIYGTILFTKGDFVIDYPKLSRLLGSSDKYKDTNYNDILSFDMQMSYVFLKTPEDFDYKKEIYKTYPDLEEVNDLRSSHMDTLTTMQDGRYTDWAYAGSEQPNYMKEDCIEKNNPFYNENIKPSEYSNRAIAFEIMLDKTKHPEVLENLGNEMAFVDKENEDAQIGLIPALLMLNLKFMEMMNPFINLDSMSVTYDDIGRQVLNFDFYLYGVLQLSNFELDHVNVKEQGFTFDSHNKNGSRFYSVKLKATMSEDKALEDDKEIDLNFKIDNNRDFKRGRFNRSNSMTHRVRFSENRQYFKNEFKNRNMITSNFYDFTLKKVTFNALDRSILLEQFSSYSWFWDQKGLYFQIGSYFPIKLEYDKETGYLDYEIKETRIPEKTKQPNKNEFNYETGIINSIHDGVSNQFFVDSLKSLSSDAKDLQIDFFNDDFIYLCSQIQVEGLKKLTHSQTKEIEEIEEDFRKIEEEEEEEEEPNLPDKDILESKLKGLKIEKKNNFCSDYSEKDLDKLVSETSYLILYQEKKHFIIPSLFITLINRKANLRFLPSKSPNKKLLDSGKESSSVKLNGKFVLADPLVTGSITDDKAPVFPDPQEIIKKPASHYLPIPLNGFVCSSLNPYFIIDSEHLKSSAIDRFKAQGSESEFYYLYVRQRPYDPDDRILFYLFTTAENESREYWLYNKDQVLKLQKDDKKNIYLNGKFSGHNLEVYTGYFNKDDLALAGLYWVLFDPDQNKAVFDCFPGSSIRYLAVKTDFIIYLTIQEEINDIIQENFKDELMSTRDKFMAFVFPWLMVLLVLFIIVVAVLIYLGYLKGFENWLENIGKDENKEKKEQQSREKGEKEVNDQIVEEDIKET